MQGFFFTVETFARVVVVMGDQWELDAEDQMGESLCICGKVSTKLLMLPFFSQLFVCFNIFPRCMRRGIS